MRTIDQITADVGDISKAKTIRPVDIRYLGYLLTDKVRLRDTRYVLYNVTDADTKRPVSFCFLLYRHPDSGVIVPYPFERYYQQILDERKTPSKKVMKKKKARK